MSALGVIPVCDLMGEFWPIPSSDIGISYVSGHSVEDRVQTSLIPMHRGAKLVSQPQFPHLRNWGSLAYVPIGEFRLPGTAAKPVRTALPATRTTWEFAAIVKLVSLLSRDEKDEFGLVRPSLNAFKDCLGILLELARVNGTEQPMEIGTDRDGAIRVSWTSDQRECELVFPFDETEAPYLYYSSPDDYGIERDLSPPAVKRRIQWAVGN